jgi:hypothetical protein
VFNLIRLIGAILLFASTLISQAAETVPGRWEGLIKIPERELKVIIDLAQDAEGSWVGSIIVPGLGIKGAPLSDISIKDSDIAFTIKSALGGPQVGQPKFKGRLNEKARLAGEFAQAGNTAPFELEKTGPPQVELPPVSTAIAKEFEGEWKGQYELFGYPRNVTLKLANRAVGGASADFVIVGKKTNNVPVDLIIQEGDLLRIESREFGINYEGRFARDAGEIKGTFEQGAVELPLVLRRAK